VAQKFAPLQVCEARKITPQIGCATTNLTGICRKFRDVRLPKLIAPFGPEK
jgi:hypothetical protein